MNPKIVIAGGSGLVGKQVADLLARNGVEVHLVSRRPTAQSTRNVQEHVAFDASLRQQNAEWGLRYVEDIAAEAYKSGLHLDSVIDMPANNLSLIFRA